MVYNYPQHKSYFYLATGWSSLFIIYNYKNIDKVFAGNANKTLICLLLLQIVFIPIVFLLMGFYFKNIRITTDVLRIDFYSPFKKINIKWDEINVVERIGRGIKITANSKFFLFRPIISPNNTAIIIKSKENSFKRCDLLREVFLKAKNAEFKGFPEDTFSI